MQIRSLKILNSLDSRKKERVEIKKHNYVHVHGSTTYDHQRPMPALYSTQIDQNDSKKKSALVSIESWTGPEVHNCRAFVVVGGRVGSN